MKKHLLTLLCILTNPVMAEDISISLQDLPDKHPRILAGEGTFEQIRTTDWDELGADYMAFLRESGEALLKTDPVEYRINGRRLLGESRKFLKRISTWALLYRIDGTERFRDRAIREMQIVADFPDWNPSHYLDVGEMTLGFAIGTDWLWDELNEDQRMHFIETIENKGLKPSLDEEKHHNWWIYHNNNWNPVCNTGLIAGAIVIADQSPDLAKKIIERAVRAIPHAMDEVNPDGIYPEGPMYWGYGTVFTALAIDLLKYGFGNAFGLEEHEGFQKSILFRSLVVAPSGNYYNFYDGGLDSEFSPATAWFASTYGSQAGFYEFRRSLKQFLDNPNWAAEETGGRMLPMLALWYPHAMMKESSTPDLPRIWQGGGPMPLVFIRESWEDPNAFFLSFKGGSGNISHAHLDAGSFILEDQGVRWAIDLGAQSYHSLESKNLALWDNHQHSDRWRVFRLNSFSHNLLLIDQRLQNKDGSATILPVEEQNGEISGTVDLTEVYSDQADSYQRTFTVRDMKVLEIRDQINGMRKQSSDKDGSPATLRWRMLTRADVEIDGDTAVLSQDGKYMYLSVATPETYTLRSEPVDPPPYYWDEPNPGVNAVDVWMKGDIEGNQTIKIVMSRDREAL